MKISPRTRAIKKGYATEDEEYPAGMDCHGHVWSDCEDAEYVDERYEESMKEINKLQEKNKELKADIRALIQAGEKSIKLNEERYNDLKTLAQDKHEICQKWGKENKELKAENEALKKRVAVWDGDDPIFNKAGKEKVDEILKENDELREQITCLESDSHNEVSQAEFDDMKEDLESQIKKLEEKVSIAEADEEEEATLSCKLLEENKQLKSDLVYAESEVARYSNALELEYVQIHEYDEMKENLESQIKKLQENEKGIMDYEHNGILR